VGHTFLVVRVQTLFIHCKYPILTMSRMDSVKNNNKSTFDCCPY